MIVEMWEAYSGVFRGRATAGKGRDRGRSRRNECGKIKGEGYKSRQLGINGLLVRKLVSMRPVFTTAVCATFLLNPVSNYLLWGCTFCSEW